AALLPPPSRSDADAPRESVVAGASPAPATPQPELLVASGREKRRLARSARAKGPAILIAADVETSARWAQRLARIDRVVRLDSGVADDERAAAWHRLRDGSARLATGTRSALLAPLRPPARLRPVAEDHGARN